MNHTDIFMASHHTSSLLSTPKLIKRYSRSAHNIIILSICVVGMYLLYRYIKSIEVDMYLLKAKVGEMSRAELSPTRTTAGAPVIPTTQPPVSSTLNTASSTAHPFGGYDDKEKEDDSVCSEELENMLRTVLGSSGDDVTICFHEKMFDEMAAPVSDIHIVEESNDIGQTRAVEPVEAAAAEAAVDENATAAEATVDENASVEAAVDENATAAEAVMAEKRRLLEDELNAKTNEELRGILKDNGENAKGIKKTLIERIVTMLLK